MPWPTSSSLSSADPTGRRPEGSAGGFGGDCVSPDAIWEPPSSVLFLSHGTPSPHRPSGASTEVSVSIQPLVGQPAAFFLAAAGILGPHGRYQGENRT